MANKKPKMRDLPIVVQDELAARYVARGEIRADHVRLGAALELWVKDRPVDGQVHERFRASGHAAQFHELPDETLTAILLAHGLTDEAIEQAILSNDTGLNYLSAEVLRSVHTRIQEMLAYFCDHPQGGTYAQAIRRYTRIGNEVRKTFTAQFGHPPEDDPIADVRITGEESPKTFAPSPIYRAPLFPLDGES